MSCYTQLQGRAHHQARKTVVSLACYEHQLIHNLNLLTSALKAFEPLIACLHYNPKVHTDGAAEIAKVGHAQIK